MEYIWNHIKEMNSATSPFADQLKFLPPSLETIYWDRCEPEFWSIHNKGTPQGIKRKQEDPQRSN